MSPNTETTHLALAITSREADQVITAHVTESDGVTNTWVTDVALTEATLFKKLINRRGYGEGTQRKKDDSSKFYIQYSMAGY